MSSPLCRSGARHSLPEAAGQPGSVGPADEGGARFSACGRYRWWLGRCWDPGRPHLLFIGLNPSRADGRRLDPTLRRLCAYGRRWGFGGLDVLNLFAWVASDPAVLRSAREPIGAENDHWLERGVQALAADSVLWLGWGNGGAWRGRDRWLLRMLAASSCRPWALGCTARGQPRHPLYCSGSLTLQPLDSLQAQADAMHWRGH